jgi:hypothetical protein
MQAYRDSYEVAKGDPQRYAWMSERSNGDLKAHCSTDIVAARLQAFLDLPVLQPSEEAAA